MNKVLWFSLSPCGSLRRSGTAHVTQGWMISLEDEVKKSPEVELHVAFFSATEKEPFAFEGVTYHPMFFPQIKNPLARILDRRKPVSSTDSKMLPLMLKVVEEVEPDLIHIHGTEERFGLIQEYVKDVPIAFSIQGLLAPISEKYFSGFPDKDVYGLESWKEKVRLVSYRNDFNSFVERGKRECGYLKKAKYIFGRTAWDEYITGLMNNQRKYYVVDEILRSQFYDKQWRKESFSKASFKIVSTISGGIYKGYETVLRSAALLKQYSGIDFEWIIAGYDQESKWVKIAERYTNIKTTDVNVKLLGRIDAEQLSCLLADSDIYVHVSHIENSPNSVCEAMLVGMPVIASFAGGTASLLTTKKEGILVQDGDPYVYAGAISYLYRHFGIAKSYGENARRRALERHNPERIGKQLLDAYADMSKEFEKKKS